MSLDNLPVDSQSRITFCISLLAAGGRGSLSAARLACRELRDLVDEGVTELSLKLGPGDQFLEDARPSRSPLLRWPMVERLSVTRTGWSDPTRVQQILDWLFADDVPPGTLARLTTLCIALENGRRLPIASVVSPLAPRLPGLRALDLADCCCWNRTAGPAVFAALASGCPALEDLALPERSRLIGIEELQGLRRLRLGPLGAAHRGQLCPSDLHLRIPAALQALSGPQRLQQLQHLRHLTLCPFYFSSGEELLNGVLAHVPPGIETLELRDLFCHDRARRMGAVRMRFKGGRPQVVEVELEEEEAGAELVWEAVERSDRRRKQLNALAGELLGWAALGAPQGLQRQRLPRLVINTLEVASSTVMTSKLPRLWQLLQQGGEVEVGALTVNVGDAVEAAQWFGTPRLLRVRLALRVELDLHLRPMEGKAETATGVGAIPQQVTSAAAATDTFFPSSATPSPLAPTGLALETTWPEQVWQEAVRRVGWGIPATTTATAAATPTGTLATIATPATTTTDASTTTATTTPTTTAAATPTPTATRATTAIPATTTAAIPATTTTTAATTTTTAAATTTTAAATAATTTTTAAAIVRAGSVAGRELQPAGGSQGNILVALQSVLQELWAGGSAGSGLSCRERVQRLVALVVGVEKRLEQWWRQSAPPTRDPGMPPRKGSTRSRRR